MSQVPNSTAASASHNRLLTVLVVAMMLVATSLIIAKYGRRIDPPENKAIVEQQKPAATGPSAGRRALKSDGRSYRVSSFDLSYGSEAKSIPVVELMNLEIELGSTADGYVLARDAIPSVRFRLGESAKLPDDRFFHSALLAIDTQIVKYFNDSKYMGIYVSQDSRDVAESGADQRPPQDQRMRIVIMQGRVTRISTIAASEKIAANQQINNPLHATVLEKSPIRPADVGGMDLLRTDLLEEYLAKLNSVAGQRVETAFSADNKPGGIKLDFLIHGDEFKMP